MFEFDNLNDMLEVLQKGGIVLYPTDTVWAIGCDATNDEAVAKLLKIKKIEKTKGLVVLADTIETVMEYVEQVPPRIDTLLMYHNRPLTVLYPKGQNLAAGVCAANGSVAFRVAQDAFSRHLIQRFEKPIVATGACIGYNNIPLTFGNISSEILQSVDFIVRYRREERTPQEPSQIVRLDENGELDFIRE
jgi:L-threonylcarbamoyladenylate synthase